MTELEKLCEMALYEEVQVLEDGRSIVRDNASGHLYYKKRLSVYNTEVFDWLKAHKSRFVPRIEAFWKEDDELVVIEELIQGKTLEEILEEADSGQELPFSERIRILTELCDGLTFLHGAKPPIIHRDLKASNIMMTEDGLVKIIDYDAAKLYVKGQGRDTLLIGTQGIAAPEQYGFAASDARTDIYALGKLIQKMLPGNADASRIADKATHIDPAKRYSSAAQIREQIRRIRQKTTGLDRIFQVIPGYNPASRKHRLVGRLSISVICVVIALSGLFVYQKQVVIPRMQQEALEAEMTALSENQADTEKITQMSRELLQEWPYDSMGKGQQERFRAVAENVIIKCSRDSDENKQETGIGLVDAGADYLAMLRECGVDEQTIREICIMGQIRYMLNHNQWEKALNAVDLLSGLPDEEKVREEIRQLCSGQADVYIQSFQEKMSSSNASKALQIYSAMIDNGFTETEESVQALYKTILEKADLLQEKGEYDNAIAVLQVLTDYEDDMPAELRDPSVEERITENNYRKGQSLLEAGEYSKARDAFREAGQYKNAADQEKECAYQQAQKLASEKKYKDAVVYFKDIPGYKEADQKCLEAKYNYCESVKEDANDTAYTYLKELLAADYPGADQLRDEIYQWHARIDTGLGLLVGSQQAASIQATLQGGPDGASTHITFEVTDTVTGSTSTWTSEEACKRGESTKCSYYISTMEYSIFEREYQVNVYADDGSQIGSWRGPFSDEFL